MSNALKCPNPSCPYLFDPSRVPAGVVLTCPRCGMRFTLGPPVPAATAPSPAAATAGPGPGPTPPPSPPVLSELATAAEPQAEDRPRRRSYSAAGEPSALQTVIMVFIGLSLLAGVGVMVYFRIAGNPGGGGGGGDSTPRLQDHNLAFEPPPAPWVQDDDTRVKLGPPILMAYKRTDPEACMAFGARDFDTRNPRQSELRDGLDRPLNNLFEDIRPEDIAGATWLGQPAVAFKFRARVKDGPTVRGLCHATSYKGIGYWSICWAGENDAGDQEATFDATRGKFKLLGLRDKWVAKQAPTRPFGGHDLPYQVIDAEDVWKEPDPKDRPASGEDPKGDLLLVARVKQKGHDRADEATLLVSILDDPGGDPLEAGQKYIEGRWTAETQAADAKFTPTFEKQTGDPEGDPASTAVEATAPVVRLKMTVPGVSSFSKVIVVSAVKVGNKVVVAQGWCAWGDRATFETKLVQIVSSLREMK